MRHIQYDKKLMRRMKHSERFHVFTPNNNLNRFYIRIYGGIKIKCIIIIVIYIYIYIYIYIIPKKTSCVAHSLTRVAVSPDAETERRECGSVEVAYDVERVGPVSGRLEVKQQYIAPTLSLKALSNSKDIISLILSTLSLATFFPYVSLPQLSSSSLST